MENLSEFEENPKKIRKDIKETLRKNLDKISEKIWRDTYQRVKFWVTGKLGSDEISFSDYIVGNTIPNPENYEKGEWLVEIKTWNDIQGMPVREFEKAKENGEMERIVEDSLIHNWKEYSQKWTTNAKVFGIQTFSGERFSTK